MINNRIIQRACLPTCTCAEPVITVGSSVHCCAAVLLCGLGLGESGDLLELEIEVAFACLTSA